MRERKLIEERKQELLDAAISLSKHMGYTHITRDGIAQRVGVSYGLVTHYFKSMDNLRKVIMKEAIRNAIVEIVAQGLVCKDPLTKNLKPKLMKKVIAYLSK